MIQAARLRLGEADHRRDPLVPVLAAGQEGEAAQAELGRLIADALQLAGVDGS